MNYTAHEGGVVGSQPENHKIRVFGDVTQFVYKGLGMQGTGGESWSPEKPGDAGAQGQERDGIPGDSESWASVPYPGLTGKPPLVTGEGTGASGAVEPQRKY